MCMSIAYMCICACRCQPSVCYSILQAQGLWRESAGGFE